MIYFVIDVTENGAHFETLTKEQLQERLNTEYWSNPEFHDSWPSESDINYWPTGIYINKGLMVVPSPVQTVTQYKF